MTPRPDELTLAARSSVAPASRSIVPLLVNRPAEPTVTVPVETRSDPWFVNVPEGLMTNCPPPVLSSTPVLTTERLTPRGRNWLLPRKAVPLPEFENELAPVPLGPRLTVALST